MSNLPASPNSMPGTVSASSQADAAAAAAPPSRVSPATSQAPESGKGTKIGFIIGGIVALAVVALAIWAVVGMAQNPETTRNVRDIFIIFLALMSTLVVAALVILIVLVARLIIMLQNEIKPLLETISETLNTLRGTAAFMSENVVNPVVQTAGFVEGARRFVEVLIGLRPSKRKP